MSLCSERLVATLGIGALLFNYPILSLFDHLRLWLGVPFLYLYLYLSWALFIALLALVIHRSGDGEDHH